MRSLLQSTSIASVVALMTIAGASMASAQSYGSGGKGDCADPANCPQTEMKGKRDGAINDQRRFRKEDDDDKVTIEKPRREREARNDWRFDSKKHERRRNKDSQFRFFFGGYWYPAPYWTYGPTYGLSIGPGISCRHGRNIVADRGFRRVRTVECQGRTYTYLGRRHGDEFKVLVSSRSGRIVDVDPI